MFKKNLPGCGCCFFVYGPEPEVIEKPVGHSGDLEVRIVAEKDEAAVDLGVDVAEGERRHRDRKRSGTPVTQDPDPAGRQPIQAGRRGTRLQRRQRSLLKF